MSNIQKEVNKTNPKRVSSFNMINKNKWFHFIGIKGAGMSALAQIMYDLGFKVKGSDVKKRFFTQQKLEDRGILITEFDESNIGEDDVVIASRAFDDSNPEVKKAKAQNDFSYYYSFLGKFIKNFPVSVAISGSHGKTTTTGLTSHVLSKLDSTSFLIGDGTGKGELNSKYFSFEACEYKNHFFEYEPTYAIVTNIDFDHPDFFKDKFDVIKSFQGFAHNVKKTLIVMGDQEDSASLQTSVQKWSYGLKKNNNIYADNIRVEKDGTVFDVVIGNEIVQDIKINSYGEHQILNALAVCSVVYLEGYSLDEAKQHFVTFEGVERRFNETTVGNNVIIDDYAHHPTEIKATFNSIRLKYPNKKAVVLFQPHTYTRTSALYKEFVEALQPFDEVYMAEIFGSARENQISFNITSQDVLNEIQNKKTKLVKEELPENFYEFENTVVAFLGAGDVNKFKDEFLKQKSVLLSR